MDKVFIVIEEDSNDESRILRVFDNEASAILYKCSLLRSGNYEHIFIEEWEIWK